MNTKEAERIRWRCRRGMLEIDLFLIPFFEECYDTLSEEEKELFTVLLDEEDPQLHAYLMAQNIHEDETFRRLIDKIRQHRVIVSKNTFL